MAFPTSVIPWTDKVDNVDDVMAADVNTLAAEVIALETDQLASGRVVDFQRYGFLNQTQTTIAFDGVSLFTLAPVGTTWSYYRAGIKYTITGSKTIDLITVDSPLTNNKTYFIYIDSADGTLIASGSQWTLLDTKVPVAYLRWNNTLTPKYLLGEERHSCLIDRRMHYENHMARGARVISAGAIAGQTINTDTNAAKTCSIGLTTLADEDLISSLAALTDPNGTATDYMVMYRTASSTWVWKYSNMPFVFNSSTNWIQYDNAGTMTDATGGAGANTRWVNSYLVFTNYGGAARFIFVNGQHIYTSLAAAQAEAPSSFTWSGFPIMEAVIAYRFTWSTTTSTSQGKCVLAALPVALNVGAISTITLGTSIDHNTMAGLQGGTTNELYHLTAAELAKLIGSTNPNILHNWDFRSPVNQRELTSYTTDGYCIDRWLRIGAGALDVDTANKKIVITKSGTSIQFIQIIDINRAIFLGNMFTFSAMIDGNLITATGTIDANQYSATTNFTGGHISIVNTWSQQCVEIIVDGSNPVSITRVKFEAGSVSTLANDAPMDFGRELAICNRYYRPLGNVLFATKYPGYLFGAVVSLPAPMRITPSVVHGDIISFSPAFAGQACTLNSVAALGGGTSLLLQVTQTTADTDFVVGYINGITGISADL